MLEIACVVERGASQRNDDRAAVNNKCITQGSYSQTAETSCLAVICDGVGGEAFGYEAAEITTEIFSRLYGTPLTAGIINRHIEKANQAVINAQKTDVKKSRMTTTIAGLYINENNFIAFNAGDSRIYRYRSYILQISKDHSVRQEQIDLGLEPKPGQENIITRYIGGTHAVPEIVDGSGKVFDNDIYVLCSDGVWGVLDNDDFEKILSCEKKISQACQALIDLALQKKSDDNLSVIIVRRT